MKKLMSVLLAVLLVLSLGLPTAFAEDAEAAGEGAETRELTEEELAVALHVIENFVALSQVPRPNGHEEKISAFFKQWAEEQGLNPVQDEVLNVVFDVPATKGYEDWPMVCRRIWIWSASATARTMTPRTTPSRWWWTMTRSP